jgi:hypothetical protein
MKIKSSLWAMSVLFLFILPNAGMAQSYRRLTTRDFAGIPAADNTFAAYTYCYVSYSYNTTRHNGNYNVDFNVQVLLNSSRSWMRFDQVTTREMMADVLKHEQGHYNIAYLMRNELYSILSHHRYTANYQYEIASLFKDVDAKYHKLNNDYETQTQHMADYKNQQKWDAWFNKQLGGAELADNVNRF